MTKKYLPFLLAVIVLWIAQLACNLPSNSATPDPFATLNGLYTASAQTLAAVSSTPGLPQPTPTIAGSATATNPPVVQSPGPTSKCDAAQFLADVTYPDGSLVPRNTTFVKIWRIRNVGTCTWTTSYAVVFNSGNGMSGPASVAMPGSVSPGQYIEIPVTFTSPSAEGSYRGYWMLRNASGQLFGIGDQANVAFWVDIRVTGPSFVAYNFADEYCKANWSNANSDLPCPGDDGDEAGYIIRLNAPKMENGLTEDEPGLLMVPQDKNNGLISGQFPALTVAAGDRFRTIINCQYGATKCNVVFRLDYKDNGEVKTFASWAETYEGKYFPVDLDLSALTGRTLKFILTVSANGGNSQDLAIWLNPHIVRQGIAPTFTFTPQSTFTSTFTLTPTPTFTSTATATPTFTETPTSTPTP
ncbi:MAG TPA: NBR1-Ig-like domain-containing protein [Anaerolineales bacterium]|nr:NBR1-Ig-like domain-containing protein [Anaerolineales bacterium]